MARAPSVDFQWFRKLAEIVRPGLVPQVCRWSRSRRGTVKAAYDCGCWITWLDTPGVQLPQPTSDGDEGAFAERFLGARVGEFACRRHGGPRKEWRRR